MFGRGGATVPLVGPALFPPPGDETPYAIGLDLVLALIPTSLPTPFGLPTPLTPDDPSLALSTELPDALLILLGVGDAFPLVVGEASLFESIDERGTGMRETFRGEVEGAVDWGPLSFDD